MFLKLRFWLWANKLVRQLMGKPSLPVNTTIEHLQSHVELNRLGILSELETIGCYHYERSDGTFEDWLSRMAENREINLSVIKPHLQFLFAYSRAKITMAKRNKLMNVDK
jgi:hypothetical protein